MPRPLANIQAEIDRLEAQLAKTEKFATASVDGGSVTQQSLTAIQQRLDKLYVMRDRANGAAPMFVRGVVRGLG